MSKPKKLTKGARKLLEDAGCSEIDDTYVVASATVANSRTIDENGCALDRKPILPGDVFKTFTGRVTSPFPKQKHEKHASNWLIQNAIQEALARGDDFNKVIFAGVKPLKDGTLVTADRESMLLYLFVHQPALKPQLMRSMTQKKEVLA